MTTPKPPAIFKPRADPHCGHCGFSLTGLPDHGLCPECGTDYDPSSSRMLYEVPSTYACMAHLGRPILYCLLALPFAVIFFPPAAMFAIPIGTFWFGWRLLKFMEFMRSCVLPKGMVVRPGTRPLGLAAMLLARAAISVGAILLVVSVLIFATCVIGLPN